MEESGRGYAQSLEKLLRVSRELITTTDLKTLYRKVTGSAKDLFDLDCSSLMLLSDDKTRLILQDAIGFPELAIGSFSLLGGQGLSTYVVLNRMPGIVQDFSTETRFEVPPIVRAKNITSALCVPMMLEEEVFGVLIGHTLRKREFTPDEVSLYQGMGNQAAVAIKNSLHIEALRESEEYSRAILDSVQTGIMVIEAETHRIVEVNPVAADLIGMPHEHIVGQVCHRFVCPAQERECPITDLGFAMDHAERELVTLHRGCIPIIKTVAPVVLRGRRHLVESMIDISERKQAEMELQAEKERLTVTLRSIGDGVITTDREGRVVLLNKVAERLTGWSQEEAAGRPIEEVFPIINEKTGDRCENPVRRAMKHGTVHTLARHTALVSRGGRVLKIADSAAPISDRESRSIGAVLVFRDVTEKRRLEEELLKAHKLESVGILAGGIAHDFNNLLTAILGNINVARLNARPGDRIYERLTEAEKASLRARDLTQQLLTFSRGGAPVKKATSIAELIRDAASFALRGSGVRCEFSLPENLWCVEVDEGQISQVLHNLIINADQAMPWGGILRVRAENRIITEGSGLALKEGSYVRISVEDEGVGISEEYLGRIFDPYFTTKQKGSGLGLATTYSIVKNHDGFIEVESKAGKGTTFTFYLPSPGQKGGQEAMPESDPVTGAGKVLIMDDEEMVREIAGEMVRYLGYDAHCAANGSEALEKYREAMQSGRPFVAVIMDLTIPGEMGGREAVSRLLVFDPGARVIVSSGYSNDPIMSDYRQYGFRGVVVKPYKLSELGEALKAVIKEK